MPQFVGVTGQGDAVYSLSSEEARARRTCLQLQAWRKKGLAPQLHSAPEGWILILDTTKWGQAEIHERSREQLIRFCTAPCESPEAAIEAALRMVQT